VSRTRHFRKSRPGDFSTFHASFYRTRVLRPERFTGVSLIFYLRAAHKRSDIRQRDVSVYLASAASSAFLSRAFLVAVCAMWTNSASRKPSRAATENAFSRFCRRGQPRQSARIVISQNRSPLVIKSLVDGYAEPAIIRIIISAPLNRAIAVYFVECHAPASGTIARSRARARQQFHGNGI